MEIKFLENERTLKTFFKSKMKLDFKTNFKVPKLQPFNASEFPNRYLVHFSLACWKNSAWYEQYGL